MLFVLVEVRGESWTGVVVPVLGLVPAVWMEVDEQEEERSVRPIALRKRSFNAIFLGFILFFSLAFEFECKWEVFRL